MDVQFTPKDPAFEEKVRDSFRQQQVMQTLGASLDAVRAGEVEIIMPFQSSLTQQDGFLHAGIITTLLDSACGYAAFSLMPAGARVLSVEFKVNLLSPAKGERFRAVAKVIRPGRNITVTQAELRSLEGDSAKLVAVMTATMMAV